MRAYNSWFWDEDYTYMLEERSWLERIAEASAHLIYYAHYGIMFFIYGLWSPRTRWANDLKHAAIRCFAMECLQPTAHKQAFALQQPAQQHNNNHIVQ